MDSRVLSPCIRHPAGFLIVYFLTVHSVVYFLLSFSFHFSFVSLCFPPHANSFIHLCISLTKSVTDLQWISLRVISSVTLLSSSCVMRFTCIVVEYPALDYDFNCALSSKLGNGARRHMDHMVNILPFFTLPMLNLHLLKT